MRNKKIRNIIKESLQARGYSESEAEQIMDQFINNYESSSVETLPGNGIFCPIEKQKKCISSLMRSNAEYKRLWESWMDKSNNLIRAFEDALKPFNKKIKQIQEEWYTEKLSKH